MYVLHIFKTKLSQASAGRNIKFDLKKLKFQVHIDREVLFTII